VDFGILYHRCGVVEFLQKLNIPDPNLKRPLRELTTPKLVYETGKFEIISTHMLSSYPLLYYLKMCRISHEIASRYCVEVRYKIGDKLYYAIGSKNNAGGYELRNPNFKGSSWPKGSTFIDNGAHDLAVFEGFFDFLSYQSNYAKQELPARNYLVLNSATLFERNLTKMQNHDHIHLFLDNDKKGQKYTLYELTLDREKFKDERHLYQKYNELNNWIMHVGLSQKQELKQKP
jgi:hypothetical protein